MVERLDGWRWGAAAVARMAAALLAVSVLVAASPAAPALAQPGDPNVALGVQARAALDAIPDEGTPLPDESYTTSNEWRHDLYEPHVRDLGGAFIGVGTDPCYTLAAYQNAALVFLVDYDPVVPLVHRLYGALIVRSPDPDAFMARFAERESARTVQLLEEALAGEPGGRRVVGFYRTNRAGLLRYLSRVRASEHRSWLSEPGLYERVRTLHRNGRVIARNGDVTADGALRAVATASAALGVPVRVLYLSNAEEFFPYGRTFRDNLTALGDDPRAVVLRTLRHDGFAYPRGDDWHYVVEPLEDLRTRIDEGGYRRMRQLVLDLEAYPSALGANGVSVLDRSVPRR